MANPNKPETIKGILISNREKLLRFLKLFLQERGARRCLRLFMLPILWPTLCACDEAVGAHSYAGPLYTGRWQAWAHHSSHGNTSRWIRAVLRCAEEDDETFAAEKADIMAEIEGLQQDPNFRLRPSASMAQGMATSLSFSALHTTGEGESGSKAFEESNTSLR